MAQWDNSAINTVRLSMMFNQVLNSKSLAIPIGASNRAVLRCLLGDMTAPPNLQSGKSATFERMTMTTGNAIEVKLMGTRGTYSGVTDGTTSRSASYTSDRFGSAKFEWTHYVVEEDIAVADIDQCKGSQAKTTSLLDEYTNFFAEKMRDTLASSVAGSAANSVTNMGGIFHAIDDSNVYGNIDRSDATNINYRSYTVNCSGTSGQAALTLSDIKLAQNTVRDKGGSAKYAFCDLATYGLVEKLVETLGAQGFAYVNPGETAVYGAPSFSYNGTYFVFDSNCPPNRIAIVSPEWWTVYLNSDNFRSGQLTRNTGTKSSYVYFNDYYAALVCKNPAANAKIKNVYL